MVRLRVLGTLDLDSRDAGSPEPLLGQPKRVALLTVVALHSARGPVSRDRLLSLLWPELSQARGRRALSQSLYVLRKALGEAIVVANGQDDVRVDSAMLWCDAVEFEASVDSGALEQALSLYAGPLLDGFHLANEPEFEHWIDLERARLEQLAVETARTLIDRETAAGDVRAAANWARRLTRIRPWDEEHLIRFVGILSDAGDAPGIRHEHELYRSRLANELGADPSPAVDDAVARALAKVKPIPAIVSAPLARTVEAAPGAAEPGTDRDRRPAARRRRTWRRAAVTVIAALATLLLFQTSREAFERPGRPESPPRVIVVPFEDHSDGQQLGAHARRAADWLSTEIARSGRVRVVPPVAALRIAQEVEPDRDTTTIGRATAAGAAGGADLVVGGYVSGSADSMVFEVFGLDPASGEILFALEPVGPASSTGSTAFDALRRATMGALASQLDPRMRDWTGPASRPPSFEAYQEYSEALDEFLKTDWESQARAAEMFIGAWRADTTFTAPLIWAIFALWNSAQGGRADSLAHALEPRAMVMPEWDRSMLEYHLAFMHGDLPAQYRAASEVVALAPNSEWRYILALAEKQVGCRQQSLATLRDLGSQSGWMSRWAGPYWQVRLDVRHLAHDPDGEARDAAEALGQLTDELHRGDEYRGLAAQIRAAAASGSTDRLETYLGEVRGLGPRAHRLFLKLLDWGPLDLDSRGAALATILDTARAWYADQPEVERDAAWYAYARLVLAYREGEWPEADRQTQRLLESGWPVSPEYSYGPRAVVAARNGRPQAAGLLLDSLRAAVSAAPDGHMRSYPDIDPDFYAARVAAILDRPSEAVQFLRAANRRGIPYDELYGIARVDFERIWDYAPLQRLVAEHDCGS